MTSSNLPPSYPPGSPPPGLLEPAEQTNTAAPVDTATELSIVVVDGARFSSTIIARILSTQGYADVRFTNSPFQALRSLEKRPADVLITDWHLPSIDGLELTRRVRATEPTGKHHTHVVLLTANEDAEAMENALQAGVDDFLAKSQIRTLLPSRVQAARRLTQRQNALLRENAGLRKQLEDLRRTDVIDPITGLGNLKFTLARIADLNRDVDSRGGAACVLLVGINNLNAIAESHDRETIDELMLGFAAKVRNLVRPLDVVTRPEPGILAVTMRQPGMENCTSHSFKRIFDNLYMHSFKTDAGYLPVVVGVSLCVADEQTGLPDPRTFLRAAYSVLTRSYETGIITVSKYSPEQAEAHLSMWA